MRLVRSGAAWIGVVDDRAALLDRVRMGLRLRFVVHADASTSTVSGDLDVKVLGRAEADPRARALVEPFGLARAVVIEVVPSGLVIDHDPPASGAVPRT